MATEYTREWIRFFTGCGIPQEVATMYSLIFYENRIQKNMLLDLNKEYLRDMGITVMGDVIAILRYAKTVHEEYVRERILSVDENCLEGTTVSSPTSKKSTPLKRILEHYTRKYNPSESSEVGDSQGILLNGKIEPTLSKISPDVGTQSKVSLKNKIVLTNKQKVVKESALEVPVPKVRRVLPENEGGYKIKMPSGITERSKKLLEQAKKQKVKTVFDRLGESSVSSTTSEITSINKITSSSGANSPVLNREKNQSVFSRLGEKTPIVSSTSSTSDSELGNSGPLPYAGILKSGGIIKKNVHSALGTMRADDEQQKSEVNKLNPTKEISVKKRLGLTKMEGVNSKQEIETMSRRTLLDTPTGETQKKRAIIKYSSKFSPIIIRENVEGAQKKVASRNVPQVEKVEIIKLKRNVDSVSTTTNESPTPPKRVRFGSTTHRLIPSNFPQPASNIKNYPKLTMTIKNKSNFVETGVFSSSIKLRPLSSDQLKQKLGIKERIGNKSAQRRLGNRMASNKLEISQVNKLSRQSVHYRLG